MLETLNLREEVSDHSILRMFTSVIYSYKIVTQMMFNGHRCTTVVFSWLKTWYFVMGNIKILRKLGVTKLGCTLKSTV